MAYKLQKLRSLLNVHRISYINYFEFAQHYSTHESLHNFCELLYVDKGEINVSSENFEGVLSVNQLIIHRPNESHLLYVPDGYAPNVIVIGFECDCDELVPFSSVPVTLSSESSNMLAQILQEAMSCFEPPFDIPYSSFMKMRKETPFASEQMIKINLEAFLIKLVREYKGTNSQTFNVSKAGGDNIQVIHQYLTENYTSRIYLDKLCFLFGINKSTLCKQFRVEYGMTILNYVNSLRIKEAKIMLRSGKKSVTKIAESLGFDSIHYFSRLFKKKIGQTPSEYSRSIKAKLNM